MLLPTSRLPVTAFMKWQGYTTASRPPISCSTWLAKSRLTKLLLVDRSVLLLLSSCIRLLLRPPPLPPPSPLLLCASCTETATPLLLVTTLPLLAAPYTAGASALDVVCKRLACTCPVCSKLSSTPPEDSRAVTHSWPPRGVHCSATSST